MVILGNALSAMHVDEQIESSSLLGAIRVDELDHYDEEWIPPFALRDGVRIKTNEKFSDHYELYEEMGAGKFGKVYRCVEKSTKLTLAAKSIRLKKDSDLKKVEKEVNIMTKMRHKCIAQIYDAFITPNSDVILIMEICEGGELFDRVEEDEYILTEMAVAMFIYQILEAIKYIHSQNIIHLDLKPENIMCVSHSSNEIKMIDFGLAQYFDGQKDLLFMAGTPEFAAPEVIKFEPLSFHTDMWSLGVMTYLLLTGVSPFAGETVAHTYCNVEKGKWVFCEEFTENGISEEAKDFISKLLIYEKEKRMLPDDCLRHSWIVQCKQRASRHASRATTPLNLPNIEKPLDVSKLRRYIRNKRFRRLVFGVMFINSVVRMMQTLQANKSTHGIEYVRNMLNVANEAKEEATSSKANGNSSGETSGLLKVFVKRRPSKASADERMDTSGGDMPPKEKPVEKSNTTKPKEQLAVPGMENDVGNEEERTKSEAKKKRSKSTARKTDQQRTRSSTEQTSKKKQRTDVAHDGEGRPLAVELAAETIREKSTLNNKQGSPKRTVKFEESVPSTSTQHHKRDQPVSAVVCELPQAKTMGKEESVVKQKGSETVKVKVTKVLEPRAILDDEDKKLKREPESSTISKLKSSNSNPATPSTSKQATNEERKVVSKVGSLLKRLEDRQSEKAAPLAFAVSAVKPHQQNATVAGKSTPEACDSSTTTTVTKLRRKKSTTKNKEGGEIGVERVAPRVIVGELERSVRSEEVERVEKRRLRKETTAETKVGDRLTERESKKSAQNELVIHELKKTTAVERVPKKATTDTVEDKLTSNECSARSALRARIDQMERLSNLTGKDTTEIEQKRSVEKSTNLAVEKKKTENGIVTRGKIQAEEKDKHSVRADTGKGILEFERSKLKKMQARENGNCEEVATECVQRVTIKKVKKRSTAEEKMTKKKAQSHDDFAQMKSDATREKNPSSRKKTIKTLQMRLDHQGHAREKRESAMSVEVAEYGGWEAVGQDVFDFSLLRKKLQNRIMGMKDEEDLATEEENRHKCEQRVQLGCNLNIKRAMKKWISMDKQSMDKEQQLHH